MTEQTNPTGDQNSNPPPAKEEKKFQHYKSSRPSTRMVSPSGKLVAFANFTFVTEDEELMAYLDMCCKVRGCGIFKGELLTAEEADPMAAIKAQAIAEYLKKQEDAKIAAAKGESRDMGNTISNSAVKALNALNSSGVAK